MFAKLLIANRGEIACRILRTARRLGVRTVAVYSDADRDSLHVAMADEAYRIGPPAPVESYLKIEALLDVARLSGSRALHPGYGFLAENAAFAEACSDAGLVFIGPPPAAIRTLGLKHEARRIMAKAGLPVVPGFEETSAGPERLRRAAAELGYPVLIKASAGGGGKGMRLIRSGEEFDRSLESCRREAAAAFGDDTVIIEKFLPRARHIEIQAFADGHGNAVHLFERDCSLQRRYQKIIEEAPAPGVGEELRRKIGEAAMAAVRAAGYVGAGTVEFLLAEDGSFYFNEMNTRLQVEHPVTELVTGVDLVEWQLRIAAGEPLPCRQEELTCRGHAIEARLYAEDPARDFLPATGRLEHLHFPPEGARGIRIDTGVRQGDAVTPHYDPLLAKLLAQGEDRETARRRLEGLLGDTLVAGVTTNLDFLAEVVSHPAWAQGGVDTGFIERHGDDLLAGPPPPSAETAALAAFFLLLRQGTEALEGVSSADRWSPWCRVDGWRLNGDCRREFHFLAGDRKLSIILRRGPDGWKATVGERTVPLRGDLTGPSEMTVETGGRRLRARGAQRAGELLLLCEGRRHRFGLEYEMSPQRREAGKRGRLTAPMPGRILALLVDPGARVRQGEPLLILEAMKMEHTIAAPRDGVVDEILCRAGDQVEEGARLMSVESETGKGDGVSEEGHAG